MKGGRIIIGGIKKKFPIKRTAALIGSALLVLFIVITLGARYQFQKLDRVAEVGGGAVTVPEVTSFPIGVNPKEKTITENILVDNYYRENISSRNLSVSPSGWFTKALSQLALSNVFQNLASLSTRILVIDSGERKEEVVSHFAKILDWNESQKQIFLTSISGTTPEVADGKFFPGTYIVARKAPPEEVSPLIVSKFEEEVLAHYPAEIESLIPLADTLTIASLLEREAYDFTDMREISGVIWNRLFADMNLQLDATLQYAKGARTHSWWPRVVPEDKYIESAFNTYENSGLPPAPIANPSLEAILAALNPLKTDCMYYFHDRKAGFHCSATYEEHVRLLKEYYGQGK